MLHSLEHDSRDIVFFIVSGLPSLYIAYNRISGQLENELIDRRVLITSRLGGHSPAAAAADC